MSSCAGGLGKSNMLGEEGTSNQSNQNQIASISNVLSKEEEKVSLPSYDVSPIFEGFRASSIVKPLQEFKSWLESHKEFFPTYDLRLEYINNLLKPYRDKITKYTLLAASYIAFTEFGQALIRNGADVNERGSTRLVNKPGEHASVQISAICIAACFNDDEHIEFGRMLMREGADENNLIFDEIVPIPKLPRHPSDLHTSGNIYENINKIIDK